MLWVKKNIKNIKGIKNKKKIFFINLLAGLGRGIGIGIGVTIITAIIITILKKIITLNIPIISQYVVDIIDIVQKTRY